MGLSGRKITSGKPFSDALTESATQEFALGTLWAPNNDPGGRKYRYALNGAVALAAGKLVQSVNGDTDHTNMSIVSTTLTAGQNEFIITAGITGALTANEYHGGWAIFSNDTGEGQIYSIVSHTNSTTPTITLSENIVTAGDNTTEMSLIANPYRDTVIVPAGATLGTVVGIPRIAVTAAYYYWLQTGGPACCLVDTGGAVPIGEAFGIQAGGATVAGAVGVCTGIEKIVGSAMELGIAASYCGIDLQLDR